MWMCSSSVVIPKIIYTFQQWLENDFLGYLHAWEASVSSRTDVSLAERDKMCLSRETLEGLRLTGVCTLFWVF